MTSHQPLNCSNQDPAEIRLIEAACNYLLEKKYPDDASKNEKRIIRRKAEKIVVQNGEIYFKKKKGEVRFVKDLQERQRILKACHSDPTSGHLGIKKTLARINERFVWPGLVKDVHELVDNCDPCQRTSRKLSKAAPPLYPIPVVSPWHHIGIDFIGPLPSSKRGNQFILTITDYFTKYVDAIPLPNKCATGVATALFKIFMRMGLCKVITSDQGKEFNNNLNKDLMEKLGIDHRLTTPYHPQANGLVERFNQTLQNMLLKYIQENKSSWDEFLDTCVFAYNTAEHESTKFSPFELMFGRKPVLPVDIESSELDHASNYDLDVSYTEEHFKIAMEKRMNILKEAKTNIGKAQKKQKKDYDKRRHCPETFMVGAMVLKKDMTRKKRKGGKLDAKWTGPFEIIASLGRGVYQLKHCKNPTVIISRVNGVHLKKYNHSNTVQSEVNSAEGHSESSKSSQRSSSLTSSSAMQMIPSMNASHDSGEEARDSARDLDQQFDAEMTNAAYNPLNEDFYASSPKINGGFFPEFYPDNPLVILSPISKSHNSTDQAPKDCNMTNQVLNPPKKPCKRKLNFSPDISNIDRHHAKRRKRKLIADHKKSHTQQLTRTSATTAAKIEPTTTTTKCPPSTKPTTTATTAKNPPPAKASNTSQPPTKTTTVKSHMDSNDNAEGKLKTIWERQPCHVVKAKIGKILIHHGSFHSLKANAFVNDEIVNGYLRLLASIHTNCYVIISQTLTAIINRVALTPLMLSNEKLATKRYIIGLYNHNGNHWILIVLDLQQKTFGYYDPFGPKPSRSVRGTFTALVKYFKMRSEHVTEDKIIIDKYEAVQLNRRVQNDGSNCGVYCLKMAEQLLTMGHINEAVIMCMNMKEARCDIGMSLLSHSEDMTERCIMCGGSDASLVHHEYFDWVNCDRCNSWAHFKCAGFKRSNTEQSFYCLDCKRCTKDFVK